MNSSFPPELSSRLFRAGVIAVLVVDDPEDAVPLANALLDGGVEAMELTMRTPSALEALRRVRAAAPRMLAGVGTLLTPAQVEGATEAGAAFGVSPGMNPRTIAVARRLGLPFAPGVCTPTDIETAVEAGCGLLKLFPSEPCGGLSYLRSVAAPFAHLGVKFIPLGGIEEKHLESYLREPCVHAVGGSWIAPRDLLRQRDWTAIRGRAVRAADLVRQVRGGLA